MNPAWQRACLALSLFAAAPKALRGMTLRARAGPVRETFLDALKHLPGPLIKLHPTMPRDALTGGLDIAETLATGTPVERAGLLNQPGTCLLTMAERCPPDLAALLAQRLDANPELSLILLDEGAEPDEAAPIALTDRLAFHLSLDGIGRLDAKPPSPHLFKNTQTSARGTAPRASRPSSAGRKTSPEITTLTTLAARLGIDTLRPAIFAARTAQIHAQLHAHDAPSDDDIRVAAELVLAPRATQIPEPEVPERPQPEAQKDKPKGTSQTVSEDMLVDAVRGALPEDLLEIAQTQRRSNSTGSGAGQKRKGNRRGRPLPPRQGRLDGTARLDLVATLRAAAPWQTLRNRTPGGPLRIYPSDIHLKRFEETSDRLIIFAVDASGSAALARLAEAKGAVELMLARAYAARDHVALIAFRGTEAQLLLPPTRSLVQTKRRLAALPGGGGTPLAQGLQSAGLLATQAQSQGLSPTLALLTDGRANIALDGRGNRAQAGEDATVMARWVRTLGLTTVVLDLGTRPQPALSHLAQQMAATYLPLPRANAERMSAALGATLDHGLGA